ncbi:homeobox protein knotted-1-like 3 [Pyrus communis]|uniref:homeobox protein knotted-1-like 3 n=1 Tax=Pyrus communis TaxID=23211 RepID=UPI0035C1A07A
MIEERRPRCSTLERDKLPIQQHEDLTGVDGRMESMDEELNEDGDGSGLGGFIASGSKILVHMLQAEMRQKVLQMSPSVEMKKEHSAGGVDSGKDGEDGKRLPLWRRGMSKLKDQQHVRVHAMEAVMACWELDQSLQSLTGVSTGEGTGATMSDDDDQVDSDINSYDGSLDGPDTMGFGPLVPTESERSAAGGDETPFFFELNCEKSERRA